MGADDQRPRRIPEPPPLAAIRRDLVFGGWRICNPLRNCRPVVIWHRGWIMAWSSSLWLFKQIKVAWFASIAQGAEGDVLERKSDDLVYDSFLVEWGGWKCLNYWFYGLLPGQRKIYLQNNASGVARGSTGPTRSFTGHTKPNRAHFLRTFLARNSALPLLVSFGQPRRWPLIMRRLIRISRWRNLASMVLGFCDFRLLQCLSWQISSINNKGHDFEVFKKKDGQPLERENICKLPYWWHQIQEAFEFRLHPTTHVALLVPWIS